MNKRSFGRTGLDVSVLGFGAAPVAYLKSDRDQAAAVLNALLDAGVNLVDTAMSYPGSEEFLGERFAHRRSEFVLVSKCGQKVDGVDAPAWSAATIAASVDQSLRRLRTDRIDVMLLHTCDLATLNKGEALGALVEARHAGKIRFAGYSGDNETAAWAATQPDVAVIETSINIVDQINIEKVLPACRERGTGVIVKRPVANGAWKPMEMHQGIYSGYAKPYVERFVSMGLDLGRIGFSGDPMQTWPEIALRFTLNQPGVHTAIIGTTSIDNALRNVEVTSMPPLEATAEAALRDAFRKADPAGKWPGLT